MLWDPVRQERQSVPREPLINEVGEWNRESCHLGFSD